MLWGKVAATDSLDVRPETLQKKRADRINGMTETDILNNWLPEDFFGYPLRKAVNEGTFKIRNNKEWDEYIERYRDGDYTNLTEADKSELKKKLSLFKIKRV
jgi:ABC-type amino acid transport substrate-binding protein